MSITLELTQDTEALIKSQAEVSGLDVSRYAADLLRKAAIREKFDAVFGPVQKGFQESGLTQDELDTLLEEELQAVRQERHRQDA